MTKTVAILSLLSISLTSLPVFSMGSKVECYNYSVEEYNPLANAYGVPMGNMVRVEKDAVHGKDRMTLFAASGRNFSKKVFLGTLQMNENGFSFSGTETVSLDEGRASVTDGKILSVQIDNYKILRYVRILPTNTVAGQQCRKGLHPENLAY